MRRGQSTVELCALAAALAVLLGVAGLALSRSAVPGLVVRTLRHVLAGRAPRHGDRWALGNAQLGPLIRRYAPRLALERDAFGQDRSSPVDFRGCRQLACAAYTVATPTSFVHVVRRPEATYLEYWFYYPDSRTDHLPLAVLAGYHHDDWEGAVVRVARDHGVSARVSAHLGFTGERPWWSGDPGWRPIARHPLVYRAAGSHANGFGPDDVDVAGDGWNGTAAVVDRMVLVPADEAPAARRRFDAGAVPPWLKRVWIDPRVASTAADGSRGVLSDAAAVWAAAEGLVA